MGNVVNLKRVRKRTAQERADKQAEINRARFGQTKEDRTREQQRADRASKMLEQHRIAPEET